MHRPDIDSAAVARALNDRLARRCARAIAAGVTTVVARIGRIAGVETVPHRLARRIGRRIVNAPPVVDVFEPLPAAAERTAGKLRVLLVSHDLSRSGAPRIVVELARLFVARDDRVTVLSGADGPHRDELLAEGLTVIVDPSIIGPRSPLARAIAAGFDVALCNTIDTAACAISIAGLVPTILYTHESGVLRERIAESAVLQASLAGVAQVWAGSELSAALVRPVRPDVAVVPYGLDPIIDADGELPPIGSGNPTILSVLASFEPRKGQDLLVEAIALLDPAVRAGIRVRMYGRALIPSFHVALAERIADMPEISLHGPLDVADYRATVLASDAVLVPSRGDTLPLVSLDALGAGRVLCCTVDTGTAAYIRSGESGFVAEASDAAAIAAMLRLALDRRTEWSAIGSAGRAVFNRHFSRAAFATVVGERVDALAGGAADQA